MTLEDLLAQFKAGFRERLHAPLPRPEGDEAIRAGIRAVVEALRDEGRLRDTDRLLQEILASDGVEAAGAPTRKDGEVSGGFGSATARDALETPAAAPVCEWTRVFDSHVNRKWRLRGCDGAVSHWDDVCPSCGKPIKFTEAK